MKRFLIALAMVAGCGAPDQPGNGVAGEQGRPGNLQKNATPNLSTGGLTGLYEGGSAAQASQLCIVDRAGDHAQFGLVVWGAAMHSCSGSGDAEQDGKKLRLTMAGDQACTIDAIIEGDAVTLPDMIPQGCSYYCGARASLAGASFRKKGDRVEDAMKAKDLVGESLCAGMAPAP